MSGHKKIQINRAGSGEFRERRKRDRQEARFQATGTPVYTRVFARCISTCSGGELLLFDSSIPINRRAGYTLSR
jgi:hypothetical protein